MLVLLLAALGRCAPGDEGEDGVDAAMRPLERMAFVWSPARQHEPFFIDRFEVTNLDFARFVRASGYRPADEAGYLLRFADPAGGEVARDLEDHPAVFVSLDDARAYAAFLGKELPTAEEWELVADGLTAPFNRFHMNVRESDVGQTTRVGTFESGKSSRYSVVVQPPVYDLLGNVWEWTTTPSGPGPSVLVEGGSFNDFFVGVHGPERRAVEEERNRQFSLGFRCVIRGGGAVLEELLQLATRPGAKQRVFAFLARFGQPLQRWVSRERFDAATVRAIAEGGREGDRVLVTAPDRMCVVHRDAAVVAIDVASGRSVASSPSRGELYQAAAADLDGDGAAEVLLAVREDLPDGTEAERLAVVRGAAGAISFRDLAGAESPASEWLAGPAELATEVLGGVGERAARQFVQTRQRLVCLDGRTLAERWTRITPWSGFLAFPERGPPRVVVPGLWWIESESAATLQLLDLLVLDGADGTTVAQSRIAGGCMSLAVLDAHESGPLRIGVVTETERLLRIAFDGSAPAQVELVDDPEGVGAFTYVNIESGPSPRSAVVTCRPRAAGAGQRLLLLDAHGAVLRARDIGAATPAVVEGDDGVLLVQPGGALERLSGDLTTDWSLASAGANLQRSAPALVDYDGDGTRELAIPGGLDAIGIVDRASGRLRDRLELPEESLLGLNAGGDGVLIAAFRDRGLFLVRASASPRSALLAELQDALAEGPDGP